MKVQSPRGFVGATGADFAYRANIRSAKARPCGGFTLGWIVAASTYRRYAEDTLFRNPPGRIGYWPGLNVWQLP